MQPIIITDALSTELKSYGIEPFVGSDPAYFKPGATVKGLPGDCIEAWSRHPTGYFLNMGSFSYCSNNSWLIVNLKVGRYCSLATGINILQGNHPIEAVSTSPWHYSVYFGKGSIPEDYHYKGKKFTFSQSYGRTHVGNDVWIGSYCTIRAGITIGDGAIIAGGANVVSDVPPYAIVGGNPAKILRYRFPEALCQRLQATQWWNIDPAQLSNFDMSDPNAFCTQIEDLNAAGKLRPFNVPKFRITKDGLTKVE